MSDYQITLKSVYSCPAAEIPKGVKLPEGWKLYWHQLETLKAIRDPNIDVIINTAMTGDGKSLAAFLETLQTNCCAVALYPTNELARDQETQIKRYIEQFQPDHQPRVVRLSGSELEIYAENEGLRKAAAIASRTGQSEILLTNPDILHYLHRGAYLSSEDSPDKLWGRIDKDFDLSIFDEFQVLAAPQIASVINTLLLIRHTNRRKKFVFLSATPDDQLINRLEIAGFRCQTIDPLKAGKYRFPDRPAEIEQLKIDSWRQILRESTLTFISLEPTSKASETWLKDSANLILTHFKHNPGSKGAIILNSIAAVKRLTPFFRELFAPHGLVVGENTGLSGKTEKERSLSSDLVLGTSTIDVGVDFKINLLIFESADAGNFIQRLGRLGRHDGCDRNGEFIQFKNFTAIALTPNFLVERLFAGDTATLESSGIYDRPFFYQQIRENYRQINNFEGYYSRWGAVQSVQICWELGHRTIKQQYASSQKAFQEAAQKVFKTSLGKVAGILSNLEIEPMTEFAFMRMLKETSERIGQPIAKGRFKHCLAFLKLRSYREERLNWKFNYSGTLEENASAWKVQVLTGIEVVQPENYWIGEINKRLKKQALVCYVLRYPVPEVRSRLRLPVHFQIYPICDRYSIHDATAPYSIAFGQSALLVDTLAHWLKSKGDEIWIA